MDELLFLGYRPGLSAVHRLDPRLKLAIAVLATAAAAACGPAGLLALLAAAAAWHCVAGFAPAAGGVRALLPLAALIVAARGLTEPGAARWLLFSVAGLRLGLLYSLRLLVMALVGTLLVSTTTAAALRAAIGWLLRPLPRGYGARAATMAGLVMTSLPLLSAELREIRLARAARLADRRRSFRQRALSLVRPLLRKALLRSDTLAAAMDARCYSQAVRPAPLPAPRPWEYAAFAAAAAAIAAAAALDRLLR